MLIQFANMPEHLLLLCGPGLPGSTVGGVPAIEPFLLCQGGGEGRSLQLSLLSLSGGVGAWWEASPDKRGEQQRRESRLLGRTPQAQPSAVSLAAS